MEAEKVVTRIVPAPVRVSVYYFVRGVILLDKGTGWVGASACRVSPPPFWQAAMAGKVFVSMLIYIRWN